MVVLVKVQVVEGEVQAVEGEVQVVEGEVQVVEGEVQVVEGEVKAVEGEVQVVEDEVVEGEVQGVGDEVQVGVGRAEVVVVIGMLRKQWMREVTLTRMFKIISPQFTPERPSGNHFPRPVLRNVMTTAVEFFKLFFTAELVSNIGNYTNSYAYGRIADGRHAWVLRAKGWELEGYNTGWDLQCHCHGIVFWSGEGK